MKRIEIIVIIAISMLLLNFCKNKTRKERFNFQLFHLATPKIKHFSSIIIDNRHDTSYCLRYMDLDSTFIITDETYFDTIPLSRNDSLFCIGTVGKTIASYCGRIDILFGDTMVYYDESKRKGIVTLDTVIMDYSLNKMELGRTLRLKDEFYEWDSYLLYYCEKLKMIVKSVPCGKNLEIKNGYMSELVSYEKY